MKAHPNGVMEFATQLEGYSSALNDGVRLVYPAIGIGSVPKS